MSLRPLAVTALALVALAGPAASQVRHVEPQIRPLRTIPPINPPSIVELQMEINRLSASVADLSAQLATLEARESARFRQTYATLFETCRLVYDRLGPPGGGTQLSQPLTYCNAEGLRATLPQ
jgi:hypothetical protein